MDTVGERIQFVQNKVGGSTKLHELTGISASQQSRLIRNEIKSPGLQQVTAIAEAGDVSLDWIARGIGDGLNGTMSSLCSFYEIRYYDIKQKIRYVEDFLEIAGIYIKPDDTVIFVQTGDEMEPTIKKGSTVVIDTNQKSGLGLFLVNLMDTYMLARLDYEEDGTIQLKRDNGNYSTRIYRKDALEIIGRPVWIGSPQ